MPAPPARTCRRGSPWRRRGSTGSLGSPGAGQSPAGHRGRGLFPPLRNACNRASLDFAVSIHAVERFLGDTATRQKWSFPPALASTGERVLVIGAGPGGLSAAYQLARLGMP